MGCAPCELGSVEHRAGIHPVRSASWPSTRTGSEFSMHQPNKEYLFNSLYVSHLSSLWGVRLTTDGLAVVPAHDRTSPSALTDLSTPAEQRSSGTVCPWPVFSPRVESARVVYEG